MGHMTQMEMSDAIALLRPTDTLGLPLGTGVPGGFLHALDTRDDFENLTIFGALLPDLYGLFMKPGVHYRSGFYAAAERFLRDNGASIEFVPADFRRFEPILQKLAPRVMATAGAMPVDGWVSLSLHAGATVNEIHRAAADPDRVLIVETSPHFPHTFGLLPDHGHRIRVEDIDVLVESDRTPLNLPDAVATEAELRIAELALGYIRSGCTLQTGIGGIPNQIALSIANSNMGDFGIHSEMFTTGLMRIHQAGKVTNNKGSIFDGFSPTTFAAGIPELYEWLNYNDAVRFLPVSLVNSPETIASNRDMVTINGALAVDLSGQVIADTIGGTQFSGIGGHEDFTSGPGLDSTDHSIVCLPSTSTVNGVLTSRILGVSPTGSVITTPRHQVDIIITEYGVAEVEGLSVRERARALAHIAHPDFRDELLAHAELWPRS